MVAGDLHLPHSEVYNFGRHLTHVLLNVFAFKMAGVFMISTCVIAVRTAIFPRWIAFSGFGCALILLLVVSNWVWIELLFPLWMLLLSVYIFTADVSNAKAEPADLNL